jgi:collagenase-like PrtC family protease
MKKDLELEKFFDMIKQAYEKGIDAVIIQDPSFISILKASFPDLHIHISEKFPIHFSTKTHA